MPKNTQNKVCQIGVGILVMTRAILLLSIN
jgi:hypothetical protein